MAKLSEDKITIEMMLLHIRNNDAQGNDLNNINQSLKFMNIIESIQATDTVINISRIVSESIK